MKKYVKPELFYEHFELNTHVANCIWEHRNTYIDDALTCTYTADNDSDWSGYVVFVEGNTGCKMYMDKGSLCYYTGADGMNTLNS